MTESARESATRQAKNWAMRKRAALTVGAVVSLGGLYFWNASWLARPARARPTLLAHRGVHQPFACQDLRADTCTAACIGAPFHDRLENTISSMRAAFEAGADVVELDVHPTTDGDFAVFHDWRLECRTNGSGVTRERSMVYLRSLDVGYGYTADGGKTFPFRGRGVGLLPSLGEVLDAFPGRRFLVHVKSNEAGEGELLARALNARPASDRLRLMVYGGERPVGRLLALVPGLRGMTRGSAKSCLVRYALLGWTGHVPAECRRTLLVLPSDAAKYLWGWPHRFIARMQGAGTEVFMAGARGDGDWLTGIDTAEEFEAILRNRFAGGVWTNRIERVGPLAARPVPE